MSFNQLISPHTTEYFFQEIYEQNFVHISRSDPAYFNNILTIDEIDSCLNRVDLSTRSYVVVKEGRKRHFSGPTNKLKRGLANMINALASENCSLLLANFQNDSQVLSQFVSELNHKFPFFWNANIYITPPESRGFDFHFDGHDVFVLQLFGEKSWKIFDAPDFLPNIGNKVDKSDYENKSDYTSLTTKVGDTLYIPRGHVHIAATDDQPSVHIALGLQQPIRGLELVKNLVETCVGDDFFSTSVFNLSQEDSLKFEIEWKERLIKLIKESSLQELIQEQIKTNKTVLTTDTSQLSLKEFLSCHFIDEQSLFKKRELVTMKVSGGDPLIELSVNDQFYKFPASFLELFVLIENGERFKLDDIISLVNGNKDTVIKLIKRLIKIGLISQE